MLVLTRKSNQSIMIGDDIEVSVLAIMGEKVRIGIQAPRDIPVFRKEVYLEIQQERAAELAGAGAEVDAALHERGRRRRDVAGHASRRGETPRGALAHHEVQRLEHRHRHEDGGAQEDEHEQPEAHRPALVPAVAVAGGGALQRAAAELLGPVPLLLRLLGERLLEGGLGLSQSLGHAAGMLLPAARRPQAASRAAGLGGQRAEEAGVADVGRDRERLGVAVAHERGVHGAPRVGPAPATQT